MLFEYGQEVTVKGFDTVTRTFFCWDLKFVHGNSAMKIYHDEMYLDELFLNRYLPLFIDVHEKVSEEYTDEFLEQITSLEQSLLDEIYDNYCIEAENNCPICETKLIDGHCYFCSYDRAFEEPGMY